jgi:hypothetical protein
MTLHPSCLFLALIFSVTSAHGQVPGNDACGAAVPVTCGGSYTGTTLEATLDVVDECVTAITAPGVWFSLTGAEAQVTVSTCAAFDFDTKINVYRGTCDALVCVAGNDDDCELGSTATFAANPTETYFILVQGYNGLTGTFSLSVACLDLSPDLCEGAAPIACGQTLAGTTSNSTDDLVDACGTSISAPGVWFTFEGDGDQVTLTTCPTPSFDTKLNIYSGSCGALTCVIGNDDTPGVGTCSTVSFDTESGTTYHVLVQGYDGETGTFDLVRTCQTCGVPTQLSVVAFDVFAVLDWNSSEIGATYVVEYGPEGFTPGTGTTVTGINGTNAPPLQLTGLTLATAYDAYLTLDCGNGDLSQTLGPLGFSTTDQPLAPNATCSNAIDLACGGEANSNTEFGTVADGPTCGPSNITTKGVWYRFIGTGETITMSTCGATDFDSKISIFTGGCGALTCVAGNDDAPGCAGNSSQVVFPSTVGTEYLILVHGYLESQGTFTLSATCAPGCELAENDECSTATVLAIQPLGGCEASTGDNSCAFGSPIPNPECDPFAPIVDVWYTFNTGFAPSITILAEAITAGIINIALYSDCEELTYLACWPEVTAPINVAGLPANTDFLVRAWNGGGPESGTFSLCIEADINTAVAGPSSSPFVGLSPVPVRDMLRISGTAGMTGLRIVDLQGRTLGQRSIQTTDMVNWDVSELATGTYLLFDDGGRWLGRFIKAD